MKPVHNSIRQIVSCVVLLALSGLAPVEAQTGPVDKDLHILALRACLETQAREFARVLSRDELFNAVVERNDHIRVDAPERLGDFRIEYLSQDDLLKRFRSTNRVIPVLVLGPTTINGGDVVIHVVRYQVGANRTMLEYGLEGGCHVYLRFDCDQQVYVVRETRLWGV